MNKPIHSTARKNIQLVWIVLQLALDGPPDIPPILQTQSFSAWAVLSVLY